jgi:hypothetical protein
MVQRTESILAEGRIPDATAGTCCPLRHFFETKPCFHIDLSGMTPNEKGDFGNAENLIREYGDAAYQKAQESAHNAHRRRNGGLKRSC